MGGSGDPNVILTHGPADLAAVVIDATVRFPPDIS
jgi:hypothetical protein